MFSRCAAWIKSTALHLIIWLVDVYTSTCIYVAARKMRVIRGLFVRAYSSPVSSRRIFSAYFATHAAARPPMGADTSKLLDVTADVNYLLWRHTGAPTIGDVCIHFEAVHELDPGYLTVFIIDSQYIISKAVIDMNRNREILSGTNVERVDLGNLPAVHINQL